MHEASRPFPGFARVIAEGEAAGARGGRSGPPLAYRPRAKTMNALGRSHSVLAKTMFGRPSGSKTSQG